MRRIDLEGKSKQELLDLARRHGIAGRSQLSKDGLIRALLKEAESKRNPVFESRGVSRPAAGARRVEPLERRSAAQRDAKQEPKDAANRKAAGASAARPASTRPAPNRDTSARSADKRESKVSGPIRRAPSNSAAGNITRPPVRLAERTNKSGRTSKESPARRSSSNAKEEAPANKTGKTAAAKSGAAKSGAAKSGTGKSVTAKSGAGKPGPAKTLEKPAPSSQSGAKKSAAKPASSPKPQTIERAPSAGRKASRAQTSASRSGRGGPFGPEGERLHGGVKPPAGFSAMDLEGMDSARETERAHATAAVPETPSARRGLGAPLAMPERYGRNYAVLMARDPQWVHVYWEIKPESLNELRQNLGDGWKDHRWVMRVFAFPAETDLQRAEEGNGEDRFDIELAPGAESWYVNVGRADRIYRVAIGIVTRDGRFHALARSNAVRTPRDTISHVLDEEWTRAPESYKRLYEMMGDSLPDGRSSAELGMLLRERLRADWSSGMLGSMASGALVRAVPGAPGFWFVLDAELIVYGATEPDAKVTVQGRPVRLRPDGTFSLRFLLPDGTQVIDATAVSADEAFRKTITPTVRRETNATETVEMRAES
ncbi:MAG: DUF4912 domain-containing protein [Candidatus Eisenbacteria bacterium]|nr:DUF4912 domain-containing protein [Candidatus Eisenbacteria bacterium]